MCLYDLRTRLTLWYPCRRLSCVDILKEKTRQRAGGVTLLKSRVTGVVNLGGVPPLPGGETTPNEWNQFAETVA